MKKYTIVITEKPDAAFRIASALTESQEQPRKMIKNGMPYYVVGREKEILIVPALGHLYTVTDGRTGKRDYPVFSFKWRPRYVSEKRAWRIQKWIEAISELAKDADVYIDACDYDVEGSIIGYNILKYACGGKETVSKRMKYSTLTKEELKKAYEKPLPHLDFSLVEAGLTRHEADWLYGINLSRALTAAAKKSSGRYSVVSTGRVQGPTLRFVVARERTIRSFVPVPYWEIKARIEVDGRNFEARFEREKIEKKSDAETILSECLRNSGQIRKIEIKNFQESPPVPFDLGLLQIEAYTLFRYTPKYTAKIAQRLYLDSLISYPRTSSQRLPPAIDYEAIMKGLNEKTEYRRFTAELLTKPRLKPYEGRKEDPAHPAICPTGKLPARTLESPERNIFDLIVRRFIAVFGEPELKQITTVSVDINGHLFRLIGQRTTEVGWRHFYSPYARREEAPLPQMEENQNIAVKKVVLSRKFTEPPARYNPRSLLKEMEREEIGTKATRGDIIQVLHDRKYVKNDTMTMTDLGFEVLGILEKHCPTIISSEFTRSLEEKMSQVQEGQEKRERILGDIVEALKPIMERLKEREEEIGGRLNEALQKSRTEENTIGHCPRCQTGKLVVLCSRKTGKRFVGCTSYFKGTCNTSAPLPQKGSIRSLGKVCRECGWPKIQVTTKWKRSWVLCLNPDCPLKKEVKKDEVQDMR